MLIESGSVLTPVLFSNYMMPFGAIFRNRKLQYHLYADDSQLYVVLGETQDGEAADKTCRI